MSAQLQDSLLLARLRRFSPIVVVAAIGFAAWAFGLFELVSLSSLIRQRAWLLQQVHDHFLLSLVAYFTVYVGLVAVSFPGASLMTITAGFLFGAWIAGTAAVCAATTGASLIFLIARSSFGDALAKRAGGFAKRMVAGFNEDAFSYLLTLRLMPVFPFWVMNIVPALLNMKFWPYVTATLLGIIPGTFAYAYIGVGLDSIIAAQEAANPGCAEAGTCRINPSSLVTPQLLLALGGLAIISIVPIVWRRWRARGAQPK